MSTPIIAGMPLSVQNPAVKWVFEPAVMSRSGVVSIYVFVTLFDYYICHCGFVCNPAEMLSKFAIERAVTWILGTVRFFGSTRNRTERTDTELGRFHVF